MFKHNEPTTFAERHRSYYMATTQAPAPQPALEIEPDLADLLRISIFAGASAVTMNRLAMACVKRSYNAGQNIISRGDDSNDVLFLLSGEVKVSLFSSEGREVAIRRIGPSEVLGDYSALDGATRSADVVAVTDAVAAHVPAKEFVRLVTADPAVALAQMRELVGMVRHLSQRVYEMTTLKAGQRLAHTLYRMARVLPGGKRALIEELPTHAELAALISSQRHVVTSELGKLEDAGLIRRQGHSLYLPDLLELSAMAGDAD